MGNRNRSCSQKNGIEDEEEDEKVSNGNQDVTLGAFVTV